MKSPQIYCIINGDLISDKATIPVHWERMDVLVNSVGPTAYSSGKIRVDSPLHTTWKQK